MDKPNVIVITGPTASGKSALAVALAKQLNTEIVSADSRQIFRHIPIATAMPTYEERNSVKHHLIDFLEPEEYYSAAKFQDDALQIISDITERTGTAIVCGGSMMYVDALCHGIDLLPTVPNHIRQSLTSEHAKYGDDWLRIKLLGLDPDYYAKVDLMNIKRVFHAVEISLTANKPYSSLIGKEKQERPFNFIKVMLSWPREILFDRINKRTNLMIQQGLEEEARSMYSKRHLNALNTVGLKEMFAYFDGEMNRETAIARIAKNTRVYAKKQMTWYKKDSVIQTLDMTSPNPLNSLLKII